MNSQWVFLPLDWLSIGWLITLIICMVAVFKRPQHDANATYRVYIIATGLLALFWLIQAKLLSGEQAGMNYHLLGVTLVTLMLTPRRALVFLMGFSVAWALVVYGLDDVSVVGLYMAVVLLPAWFVTTSILFLARRFLPHHLFVFIFVNGFFGGGLSMMASGLVTIEFLDWIHAYPSETLWSRALPVYLLLSWGEAFLSGLLSAVFIAFMPQLLMTYSDQIYLPRARASLWQQAQSSSDEDHSDD